jgi:hypothetical protein
MSLPPPMAPGSDPYGAVPGPPPPASNSNKTLFIVLGVVAVILLLCCCGGAVVWAVSRNNDNKKNDSLPVVPGPSATSYTTDLPTSGNPYSTSSSAAANGKVGTTVKQGAFEVTVTSKPQCGIKHVGTSYRTADADGQFCLIDLKFHNTGTTAVRPISYRNKLTDTAGGETSMDIGGTWYSNPGDRASQYDQLWQNIYPGATATGTIAFDIPVGQTPSTLYMNPFGDYDDPGITIDLK